MLFRSVNWKINTRFYKLLLCLEMEGCDMILRNSYFENYTLKILISSKELLMSY